MAIDEALRQRVERWIEGDPDPVTSRELQHLLDAHDVDELAARMDADLTFGTAGLRGRVEAGSDRMNRAVVIRATRGLADHLRQTSGSGRVVVAHDARPDSERFAADAVGVLVAAGFEVTWFRRPTPTPVAAYLTRVLDAVAGVVVTASHNPPADNGYKVFARGGIQITAPTDTEIAAAIAATPPAASIERVERPFGERVARPDPESVLRDYLDALSAVRPDVAGDRAGITVVTTPMHGVGGWWVEQALVAAGHAPPVHVASQWDPDGSFPTVTFPNPEEEGALDAAFATAEEAAADVVLALDPDADRLAVGIPTPSGWRRLTGDELGCLLADHLLAATNAPRPAVASSIVSSRRLERVAAHHDATCTATLTGFKWIWRALAALERDGLTPVLGYEEAIGYSVGDVVRDKDGIGAAVVVADLVAQAAASDRTLADLLDDLDARVGRWANEQRSVRLVGEDGAARIAVAMRRAREVPADLGGTPVERLEDLLVGAGERPAWLPADDVVIWHLAGRGRVLVRPSGTEPKLKVYVDVPVGPDEDAAGITASLADAAVAHLGLG